MPRVFISYARSDREQIDRLAARLAAAGHSVFVDRDCIMAGDAWRQRVVEAIERADIILVALSASSVASPQVRREVEIAQERDAPVVPVTIEAIGGLGELRYHLSGVQRIGLEADFEGGVSRLLQVLRPIARRAGIDPDADDPELKAPRDAILADPELSTREKIRRWMELRREQLETSPSRRRGEQLRERIARIDLEISSIYAHSPAISLDDENVNPYCMVDEDSDKERLAALRRQRSDLVRQQLGLIEAGMQGYDALIRKADALRERYDAMIRSINSCR